ncbi:hypothetical protein P7K49_023440 [Saguinus oedipus]|uniref:Uncharacterized protein n=1 Tax=Saguinus oedipus TaxID=9490 RepID=A0ABQ9UMG1_SAGOE|nr:hypothetical protein P7K49_023440 [Saguinus oedipus]
MSMSRLPMVTCFVCSVLVFLRNTTIRYGRPLMLSTNRYQIQKKMMEIMTQELQTNDLKEVVSKLIPDSIGKNTGKACQSIYPLHDIFISNVKMLQKPKKEIESVYLATESGEPQHTRLNFQPRVTRSLPTLSDPESTGESIPESSPEGLKGPPPLGDRKKKVQGVSGVRTVGILHC